MLDLQEFIRQFHDHLAPRLDTYEQAIYLYLFRHGRLEGKEEVVIGFKSARGRMACGIGEKGKPMSENTAYVKLQSLQEKGCLQILDTERKGRRIRLNLPCEIPGLVTARQAASRVDLEQMDFFNDERNRPLILEREDKQCFYCLRDLNDENHVIEHVVSRPEGGNGYRNVVAACRGCNNRKLGMPAEDFLRLLYREAVLSATDLQQRLDQLARLRAGDLRPCIDGVAPDGIAD
jgi:5-methylcytosine-specific restriction endonuclease McrA